MLVLVPSGKQHVWRGGDKRCTDLPQCFPLESHLAHLPAPDVPKKDTNLVLLCAYVDIALRGFHNVLYGIMKPIAFDTRNDPTTAVLMPLLIRELSSPRVGGKSTIRSLVWIAFIQLLRAALEQKTDGAQDLRILKEPRLLPAIQTLLADLRSAHSVEPLATLSAMSRSVLAARFREIYGIGPMEFLRRHRVESAAKLLRNPSVSVEGAAYEVGFGSRSAFSRAFQGRDGVHPPRISQSNVGFRRSAHQHRLRRGWADPHKSHRSSPQASLSHGICSCASASSVFNCTICAFFSVSASRRRAMASLASANSDAAFILLGRIFQSGPARGQRRVPPARCGCPQERPQDRRACSGHPARHSVPVVCPP